MKCLMRPLKAAKLCESFMYETVKRLGKSNHLIRFFVNKTSSLTTIWRVPLINDQLIIVHLIIKRRGKTLRTEETRN